MMGNTHLNKTPKGITMGRSNKRNKKVEEVKQEEVVETTEEVVESNEEAAEEAGQEETTEEIVEEEATEEVVEPNEKESGDVSVYDSLVSQIETIADLEDGVTIAQAKVIFINSLNKAIEDGLELSDINKLYNSYKDTVFALEKVPAYLHLYDAPTDASDAYQALFTALGMKDKGVGQDTDVYLSNFKGKYAGMGDFTSQLFDI